MNNKDLVWAGSQEENPQLLALLFSKKSLKIIKINYTIIIGRIGVIL